MKRHLVFALFLVLALVLCAGQVYATAGSDKVKSQTGKVTAIDPEGKGIVITVGKGKTAMDVGTIIQPDTALMVKGKKVPLSDLNKEVKVGDTVMLKYVETNDLYAKEIVKR